MERKNNIKIYYQNVATWTRNGAIIKHGIDKTTPDIIILNDIGQSLVRIKGYRSYNSNPGNEMNEGVAIAIRGGLKARKIKIDIVGALAIEIETSVEKIIFVTKYLPPRKDPTDLPAILKFVADQHAPCYFLGDLNALYSSLGHQRENNRGRIITDVIRRGGINHAGPDFNTYFGPSGKKGKPDIVLTNRHAYLNFHLTKEESYGSDHIAMIMRLGTAPMRIKIKPMVNYKKADWEKIKTI